MRTKTDEQRMVVKIPIPKEFFCPITGKIMSDPVILSSAQDANGKITHYPQRYERIAIIRYFYNHQLIRGNLSELLLDEQLRERIEGYQKAEKFKKFDSLAYILQLENGNIGNTLLFFCKYARDYADQFVLQYQDKIAQNISELDHADNNLLARVLMARYSISTILNSLTPDQAAKAILATNYDGRNTPMLACEFAPAAVEALLRCLTADQAVEAIILARTKGGSNALMLACRYAPDAVAPLLDKLSNEQVAATLAQVDLTGWNTLRLLCRRNAPDAIAPLLAKLSIEQIAAALVTVNMSGWNALMIACLHTPAAVAPLIGCLNPEQAATTILARNKDGYNSLTIACYSVKNNINKTDNSHSEVLNLLIKALQNIENHLDIISQNVEPAIMQYLLEQNYIAKPNMQSKHSTPPTILQSATPDGFFCGNEAQQTVTKKPKNTKGDDDDVKSTCENEPKQKK